MSDIVKFTLENAGVSTLSAGVATFGQVFLPGELPSGTGLVANGAGGSYAVQMDVKTRYEDGSVKMAVLSVERPDISAGGQLDLTLATAAPASAAALDLANSLAGHSFQVDVSVHGGAHTSVDVLASLQKALADGTASFWQEGPLASQARVEVPLEGSQRMIFDVTAFKGGGFEVEAQFNNDGAMAASGGAVSYDVVVTMDGKQALNTTVNQAQYQNWHENFSSNDADGGQGTGSPDAGWLNIRQDIAHLQEAGVVAAYNLGLTIDPSTLAGYGDAIKADGWGDPLAVNGVTQYMPGVGGRPDIGITTAANTTWLITQDANVAAYAMGQAETSGAVPWNFWDAKNGTWLSTDDYPYMWTDERGGTGVPGDSNSTGLTQQVPSSDQTGWAGDVAHQPNLSFVPYVLTGERWMLDNLQAQASSTIVGQWNYFRGDADDNVVNGNQVRGGAWALREIDNAAWAAPDGSPEKAYFQEASNANYAWLVSMLPEWTAQQGEVYGWLSGPYNDGGLKPWQQDYFASTVIAAASRGNADALTFLEWQSNFLIGRFTHASEGFDPHDGAAYQIAIADMTDGAAPYTTWAQVAAVTDERGWSNDDGWSQSGGDYAQLAMATLAGIYHLTGNAEAKAAYEALAADNPPYVDDGTFASNPTYAIAAPGAETGKPGQIPTQPSTPTPVKPTPEVPPTAETPTPEAPTTPAPDQGGDGLASLAVVLGADSWEGDPLAAVQVNGQEVWRGTISAQHGSGGQQIELGRFATHTAHTVSVQFLNDDWGGSLDLDRNLHVEAVLVNGSDTGNSESLFGNGEAAFRLAAEIMVPDAQPATPQPTPTPEVTPTPVRPTPTPGQSGDGLAALAVVLGADSWEGDPLAAIMVDGQEVFRGTISAQHGDGGQRVELGRFSADQAHDVTVQFLNDGWGGSLDLDRNLHVESVLVNGVDTGNSHSLFADGEAAFHIGSQNTAPDVLKVGVSGDAWEGDASFLLFVDGVQMGGEHQAAASRSAGEAQLLEFSGDFGDGAHELVVRFLNDAWGGSESTDRNLYVESVEFNGVDQHQQASLMQNGDAIFAF